MEFAGLSASNRYVLSPDAAASALPAVGDPLANPLPALVRTRAATSLLFIDSNIADYQSLVAGVTSGTEVHVLDPIEDAVTQITQTLLGRTGISSVHIVSHGQAGGLRLGTTELNASSLDRDASQISSWSQALTEDADILLYGCEIAQGDLGFNFVQRLGQITGADIAASTDRTGDRDAGGNWNLEVHTGDIAAGLVFQSSTLANYHHLLPVDLLSPIVPSLLSTSDSTGGTLGISSVSDDGRYIVFTSNSGSLIAGDANGKSDVFWLDRQSSTLKLVSHNVGKTGSANGASSNAVISGDGLSVAFVSDAADIVSGDQNTTKDVFLWKWDSATNTDIIRLVSAVNNGTSIQDGDSYNPVISGNGQYVSFLSDATNLTSKSDLNNQADVFQWDGLAVNNAVTLVSRSRSKTASGDKGVSSGFSMSRDGNYVAFSSNAGNLPPTSDTNGQTEDVFRWSRADDTLTVISTSFDGLGADAESNNPVLSNDGSRIAFTSTASNLVADGIDGNSTQDIFLWDSASLTANKIRLISFNSAGTNSGNKSTDPFAAGSGSLNPVISGDGKYVAFSSYSTDLVSATDDNGKQDVFVREIDALTTFLVSSNTTGLVGNDVSSDPSISGDGKRISFASSASNLVAADTNGKRDVFVRDLTASTTSLVSRSATAIGNDNSPAIDPASPSVFTSVISADGAFVAFTSQASNLVDRDSNSLADVFVAQLSSGAVSLVSRQSTDPTLTPKTGSEDSTLTTGNSVSADGRYVVYTSKAPELAAGDANGAQDVFIRDNQAKTVTLISRNAANVSGNGNSFNPVISRDGQFVVFVSDASDLVLGDTNGASDLFLWERSQPNTLTLISKVNAGTVSGDRASINPIISGNGQYVVFTSLATNLVDGDSNAKQDVFVWERSTKKTTLVSHANGDGNSSNGTSENSSISNDGRLITFTSDGTNLATGATTGQKQVFLWDRQTGGISLISQNSAGTIANAESNNAVVSSDGLYVAFTSSATNLFGTDNNAAQDVFIRDLVKNTTTAVSVDSLGAYGTVTGGLPVGGAFASSPVISSYGGKVYIAFTSTFNTLVATDNNSAQDVFVREIDTNDPSKSRTILVSVDKDGTGSGIGSGTGGSFGGSGSLSPLISQDGRFVAFVSYSNNLVASDTNGAQDIFVRDLLLNKTTLISSNSAGTDSGKGASHVPAISGSGSYIAFTSDAGNLVAGDFNNKLDVFGQELLSVVSLTAIDPTASEATPANDPAVYQIKRSTTTGELTVKLAIDPTSTVSSIDYDWSVNPTAATIVSFTATDIILKFLAGADTIDLTMTPRNDVQAEAAETLKLFVTADATTSGYAVSTSDNTATTTILANDTVVTNTNDSGEGSLRQAMINANAFPGANTISFAISGSGVQTIALQSTLPVISDGVTIDGTTQTGFVNAPLIVLDGTAAGATTSGLHITAGGSTIKGLAVRNFAQDGILIDTQGNNTVQQNDLSANKGSGVAIVGTVTGNRIEGNTFTGNTGLGIDLGKDGSTANDAGDLDVGANNLQNFPVLTIAESVATGATIGGTLNSNPSAPFRVEFFSNDATGTAQGKTFLGFTNVTTDATGTGSFSFTAAGAALGQLITATATDASGNTSELSQAKAVAAASTVSLSAAPVTLPEGTGATPTAFSFVVTLSQPSSQSVVVTYSTADGTATSVDGDYATASAASITFAPGQTSQTIAVGVTADSKFEPDETFTVTLNGATNATLTTAVSATGTIQNDDSRPTITITDASQLEGNSGSQPLIFTASLSNLSTETVVVDYATANDTATLADNDYAATTGKLTFAPGQLTQTLGVLINGDTKFESNETFKVALSNPSNGTIVPATSTATGTIGNDDLGPTLSITTPTAQLEGTSGASTPYLFVVNLSQPSSQEITVDYGTIDDSATIADNDYTAATGTLTFAPNTTSQTLTVFSKGDTKFEPDEQFFVKLNNPKNANLSATVQATGIITSDDTVAPTIGIAKAEASEGNTGTTPYSFVVTLSDASSQTITVNYSTADGTATIADNDYTAATGTLTFAPNETRKTITVLGTGDNKYEGNETFLVNLALPQNATLLAPSATGTITNDDLLPLISINDVSSLEGDQGTTKNDLFTVNLSNPTDQTVTVNFATADGTVINSAATTADGDYLSASGIVTFNPGEITKTISVVTNGDANLERDEDFFVNLSNATQAGILKGQGKGTIVNDDTAPTLKINSVSQKEGNQNTTELTFTVSLSATSNNPITVEYLTQDNTATIADLDYQTKTGTLTFAPNTLTQTFAVLVNGDSKLEGDETFSVKLQNPSLGALISATEGIGIGTIGNDDRQPTIGIDQKISITEGTSGAFTVSLSNPSIETVTVKYATADDTATLVDRDYTQAFGTLTFNPGELNKTITVSSQSDTKFEGNETFTINLSQAGNADVSTVSGQGTVTIVNDDSRPTVSIDNLSQQEGQSGPTPYIFTASLSNPSSETITVNYATSDGSATLLDNDYTVSSGTITFNPDSLSQKITVLAKGDSAFEPDENFFVNLSPATNATTSAAAGVGKGTLLNDDNPPRPTIRIDSGVTQLEGNKGATTAYIFNVILSTITPETVTVGYTTKDNSATTLDNDYTAQSGILTFAPNTSSQKITVLATGDDTLEPDESFFIDLQNPSINADISPAAGRGTATLTNEDKRPTLNIDSPTKREGAMGEITPIEFVVTLSNPSSQTVTVDYGTGNGSATIADSDFVQATGKLTFNAGELKKTITVSANGDSKFELDEAFTVQLTGATNADITGTGQGIGTLLNDDFAPTISLESTNASQPENATNPYLFVVKLSNPTEQIVTVNYDTSDGTATIADNDYSRATGTLTFAPTEISKTISVSAIGDTKYEGNETFTVNLRSASNATIPTGTISAIATIVDDDPIPTISLTAAAANQPEGQNGTTPYVFTARLTSPSSQAITVDYATADGTATLLDKDYLQATGKLTFAPTETSKTFTVFANGDTKYEGNETFTVSLSNAAIGSTISPLNGSVMATIANDDTRPTISLTPVTLSLPEGNGITPYVFTVALSEASSEIITLSYNSADGTATLADNDYTAISDKLTFNPGETTKNLTVNAVGDTRFEKDETFQLNLTNPTNATFATATSATGTIINDDTRPIISLTPVTLSQPEGNAGSTPYIFTVALSGASSEAIIVNYSTADGKATVADNDYTAISDKLTFNPGETTKNLTVNVAGDTRLEEDETFQLNLTNPTNATFATSGSSGAVGTIANDDKDLGINGDSGILWRNQQSGDNLLWQLNSSTFNYESKLYTTGPGWNIKGKGDFNGDGSLDILWRNEQTGENTIWLMNGTDFLAPVVAPDLPNLPDISWQIEGVADFNRDGKVDLLWRNYQTGAIAIWLMDRTRVSAGIYLPSVPSLNWQIEGIGDFDGDRKVDLLWRNDQTGENAFWLLDDTKLASAVYLPAVSPGSGWGIEGIGDFNKDGSLDLLWRNKVSNAIGTWQLNRTAYVTGSLFSTSLDSTWQVQKIGDFNRDNNLDILWRNTQSGENKLWYLNGTTYGTSLTLPTRADRNWLIAEIGDFNRDGNLDLLWQNVRSNETDIWNLNSTPYAGEVLLPKVPDLAWKVQATGDFNRDGSIDLLWRNYRDGAVAFWQMAGTTVEAGIYSTPVKELAWKIEGAGDFDRDGFLDLFWYNENTGQTAIWTLNGTTLREGIFLPTPGRGWQTEAIRDFDQDGNLDILWRSQAGEVALWKMRGTSVESGIYLPSVPDSSWQIQGVGDFNSDGKPDIFWRNYRTGENAIWQLNGTKLEKALYLTPVTDLSWRVEGFRDYNGDGTLDLLWRNYRTGENAIWFMNDATTIGLGIYLPRLIDPNWTVEGVDSFRSRAIE